jgi:Domain of unknown function (DUF4406)
MYVMHEERGGLPSMTSEKLPSASQRNDPSEAALRSFLDGLALYPPRTVYLSTPVTTGRWFYEQLLDAGAQGRVEDLPVALVEPVAAASVRRNASTSTDNFEALKARLPDHNLINPAALQADWPQEQFLDFWVAVIYRFVGKVVLAPDWQYSTGASFECAMAMKRGIPVVTFDLEPITPQSAEEQLQDAISDLKGRGLVPSQLISVLATFDGPKGS